jgi:hypothetical protein
MVYILSCPSSGRATERSTHTYSCSAALAPPDQLEGLVSDPAPARPNPNDQTETHHEPDADQARHLAPSRSCRAWIPRSALRPGASELLSCRLVLYMAGRFRRSPTRFEVLGSRLDARAVRSRAGLLRAFSSRPSVRPQHSLCINPACAG